MTMQLAVIAPAILNSLVTTAPVENQHTLTGCFQCMTIMNREWRSGLTRHCNGTKDDCGKCIDGYDAKDGAEICAQLKEVSIESGNKVVPNDATVTLKCKFGNKVDCAWSRRGFPLQISSRYSYTDDAIHGMNTRDCSIRIEQYNSSIDYGEWVCSSLAGSSHGSTISTTVNLISGRIITVEETDKKAFIPLGGIAIIKCQFNRPVDCAWSREKYHLDVSGRYSYAYNENGQRTNDCSIRIDNFEDIDIGAWDCQSMGDSTTMAIQSTNVQLNKVDCTAMVEFPTSTNVSYGENVTVDCKFNAKVECQWQLNGAEAPTSRYHFMENNSHKRNDCSIEIQTPSIYEQHIEVWTCYYRGTSSDSTSSNTARIAIFKMPSPPEIFIENSTTVKRSIITSALGKQRISCSSFNGWPAAELRWEIEGQNVQPSTSSKVGENVINTTITLDTVQLQHFKSGTYTLKCVASHPAFQTEMVVEEAINITNEEINDYRTTEATTDSLINDGINEGSNFDWRIVAIVAAGLLTIVLIIAIPVFILLKHRKKKTHRKTENDSTSVRLTDNLTDKV